MPSIAQKAFVSTTSKPDKKYFRLSETPYLNHKKDFRHKEYVNSTELSKYIWKLKEGGETPSITWNIMPIANCLPRGGICRLCLQRSYGF